MRRVEAAERPPPVTVVVLVRVRREVPGRTHGTLLRRLSSGRPHICADRAVKKCRGKWRSCRSRRRPPSGRRRTRSLRGGRRNDGARRAGGCVARRRGVGRRRPGGGWRGGGGGLQCGRPSIRATDGTLLTHANAFRSAATVIERRRSAERVRSDACAPHSRIDRRRDMFR